MQKVIITILGPDRPGIIAAVSQVLFDLACNLENVSQTILQSEFAGIFLATVPDPAGIPEVERELAAALEPMGLYARIKPLETSAKAPEAPLAEPFVITTSGPDRKGLVAAITRVLAAHKANVTNLQAIFKGGADPLANIMIYEIDIPPATERERLFQDLRKTASGLELDITIQHRRVFEAINRI